MFFSIKKNCVKVFPLSTKIFSQNYIDYVLVCQKSEQLTVIRSCMNATLGVPKFQRTSSGCNAIDILHNFFARISKI